MRRQLRHSKHTTHSWTYPWTHPWKNLQQPPRLPQFSTDTSLAIASWSASLDASHLKYTKFHVSSSISPNATHIKYLPGGDVEGGRLPLPLGNSIQLNLTQGTVLLTTCIRLRLHPPLGTLGTRRPLFLVQGHHFGSTWRWSITGSHSNSER